MRFFFKWLGREIRNDAGWVSVFVLSLALGLFGFIALQSFRDNLEQNLNTNARLGLAGDFSLFSRRKISEEELREVRKIVSADGESHLTEFFSMLAAKKNSRLVQIKAIDQNYPLYGELKLKSGKVIQSGSGRLNQRPLVWIDGDLRSALDLQVGDRVKIGQIEFQIDDVIENDPSFGVRISGIAPEIYISEKFLPLTGLMGPGTVSNDYYLWKISALSEDQLESLSKNLKKKYQDPGLHFETALEAGKNSMRGLQTLLDYLGLVSLVGLALSLVGGSYLIQLFLSRRLVILSLLRTLGLRQVWSEIFILGELAIFGFFAICLVLPSSYFFRPALSRLLAALMPVAPGSLDLTLPLGLRTASVSVVLALVLPVLVAWPLLRALRKIDLKQILLNGELWQVKMTAKDLLFWIPAFVVFLVLSIWISHSIKIASIFTGSVLGAAVFVLLVSGLSLRFLPKIGKSWQALSVRRRLRGSPLKFGVVILAMAFGTLLLVLLPQIRESLAQELKAPESIHLPSLFLFDIQDDQMKPLVQFLENKKVAPQNISPMIRARILSVNGDSFERAGDDKVLESREDENEARFRIRGVNLTYRADFNETEELVSGRKFSKEIKETAEISVEKGYAERLHLKLGDRLRFGVQGIEIDSEIVSLRNVRWNSFQPNFFISFQPGFLDDAPKSWLMSLPHLEEAQKSGLQNEIVSGFPNVSVVNVTHVVDKIIEMTDQISAALTVMAIISVLAGLFVLATVLVIEAGSRMVEWNLYKVLGAGAGPILRIFLLESAVVAFIAIILGAGLGLGIAIGLMTWMFSAPFVFALFPFIIALLVPFAISTLLSWQLGLRLTRPEAASLLAEDRL